MSEPFIIAHTTVGRSRIRWGGKRAERAAVREVAERVKALEGVQGVVSRLTTGSIIIEHPGMEWPALAQQLSDSVGLSLVKEGEVIPSGMELVRQGLDGADDFLRHVSDERLELRGLLFSLLVSLAITQMARGRIMAPASTLLWYALDLAKGNRLAPPAG